MSNSTERAIDLEDFFKTVSEVQSLIEKISSQTEEMDRSHSCTLSSLDSGKRSKDELELLNNEIRKNANLVQTKLKLMQKNCASDENRTNNSVSHRIQRNQHSHLTRRFSEVMKNYHQVQISFREKCKAQIQRHLEIVGKVMTDDELEDVLPCDNLPIFIPNTNFSSQALTEIERRHQDIISLEYSIKELHELFTDTAMLLETQGELINSIEKNVTSAGEYAGAAVEETKKAIYYSKNPYQIAPLPISFKLFKRYTSTKTAADGNSSKNCTKHS
ncbi:syntaxin-2-like [Girardinichthys multiradiatus]|uniref:syntaxin-2-like n=1 Tax=Girardinichthys multiradiatus TaxID=208333 RepID=UPI001FAD0DD2|nr:syntaxin-2-like [Girardinichthys multiradiatus]XP_047229621.1 syntaxin-2-like [Girardinichthys multiradiatus]